MLIGLELGLAHLADVLGAVRIAIALERADVWRSIARTSIQHAEEGRADSNHAEGLPQRERKRPRVLKVKRLCTREFAVQGDLKYRFL